MGDCDHSSSGWTYETLRIHLMAVMDERKEASKDAVKTALEAVRTDQARSVALSVACASVISAIVAISMLVLLSGHK